MRIAIMGASGTGKTTLATAISTAYGLPLNPVGARSVALEMGFQNPYDVDAAGRREEFQMKLFEQKLAWERWQERFVTDRTYLDNLTYCALHMPAQLPDEAIAEFMSAMSCYDLVFCLWRADFQSLGDGVRQKSQAYHDIYERLLESFVSSMPAVGTGKLYSLDRMDRIESAFKRIQRVFPDACKVSEP